MFQGNRDHYFYVGFSAINCINSALTIACKDQSSIEQILDLPCGYGRITRWLTTAFPDAKITACDLDKDAVDFCRDQFGANPVYSDINPEKIHFAQKFDLIWCGSLFTHLNNDCWIKFFKFFDSILNTDGIFVFTTHGRYIALRWSKGFDYGVSHEIFNKVVIDFKNSGFGYHDYYSTIGYGVSLSKPSYVFTALEFFSDLRIVMFQEKGWDHHHDVIACYKDSKFEDICFDYQRSPLQNFDTMMGNKELKK
jgi:SAM-dependent methyltransferase